MSKITNDGLTQSGTGNRVESLHKNRNALKQKANRTTIYRQCRDPVTQLGQK